MRRFIKILMLCLIIFMAWTINVFAVEEGETVTYNGITTTMPEVSSEENDAEDPIDSAFISMKPAKATTDGEVGAGIDNENISNIITKFSNQTTVIGIDVSRHQGTIDWKKVADSGVKFAILRCGYRGTSYGNLFIDSTFETNAKNALANGIYIGAYFYSTALNEEEALQEAVATVDAIKGFDIKYPVYYDFEDFLPDNNRTDNMSVEQINKNARVFLNYVKSKGYNAALYGSANYLKTKWDSTNTSNYDVWVAHYYVSKPNYTKQYQMWQYTDKAQVPGISTKVDVNVDYNYWAKMKVKAYILTHRAYDCWEKTWKAEGETSGTTGQSKRIEAMKLKLETSLLKGDILYKSYVQGNGWEDSFKKNGEVSGTTGQAKRLEAIQIKLSGDIATYYDIYYRVHVSKYCWLGWAKNGECAGTEGQDQRIEAIQIKLVPKAMPAPGSTDNKFIAISGLKYRSHVAYDCWLNYVENGQMSGTTGQSKRMEAIQISLNQNQIPGNIEYKTYIQDKGWEDSFKKNGETSGTTGQAKRIEAIQIKLSGEIENYYDVYYRVHVSKYCWLGWAKNGESAGTINLDQRIEAIEIRLVLKGEKAPGTTENKLMTFKGLKYRSHIAYDCWLNYVENGQMSGTTGQSKRMEAIQINLLNLETAGNVEYKTYIQGKGWEDSFKKNGETSGTTGQARRIEAIQIKLTGDIENYYDIYYRVHISTYCWLGWAKNGEKSGSEGLNQRIEAIEIRLVPKGEAAPGDTSNRFVVSDGVRYRSNIQSNVWQDYVVNGELSGTTGQYKRLEAIEISLINEEANGDIEYRTCVEGKGWEDSFKKNGETSGTIGESKKLEAIQIKLTGEMSQKYDVYYRTHVSKYCWLGWAKNGESAGTEGLDQRIEAIQIMFVPKGSGAPGDTSNCYKTAASEESLNSLSN